MNNTEMLFRYVQKQGDTASCESLRELGLSTPISKILWKLNQRDGVAVLRLNKFLEPLPVRNMSKRQIGLQTEHIKIVVREPQAFLRRPDSNGQSEASRVVKEILEKRGTGFLLPCRRPLEPEGKCYHGPKCANGHQCPVAVSVRKYRRYDDQRVQVREQLEAQGYKGGWRFTIEDVFGKVSLSREEQNEENQENRLCSKSLE